MSSDVVLRVENLGKRYRLHHANSRSSGDGLRHALHAAASAPFKALEQCYRRMRQRGGSESDISHSTSRAGVSSEEEFWALKDVTFEVKRGEVFGIIGRNGAGKSTLLKILSRITESTYGRIGIKGRVASLLEVGTGFHPELTGRENIFLNGAVLGMNRAEVWRKFDEIVAFAEVEKFLDTPVKHYSSGMYVRLAFAVAAHLESDILIVDEVLAVGDSQFQAKCLSKMDQVSNEHGRTVLIVSHNLDTIASLCSRGVLLEKGGLRFIGSAIEALQRYSQGSSQDTAGWSGDRGDEHVRLLAASVSQGEEEAGPLLTSKPTHIDITVKLLLPMRQLILGYSLYSEYGYPLIYSLHDDGCAESTEVWPKGDIVCRFIIPENILASGRYYLGIDLGIHGIKTIVPHGEHLLSFELVNKEGVGLRHGGIICRGVTSLFRPDWGVKRLEVSALVQQGSMPSMS